MIDKDYYMMGIKNCMNVMARVLRKDGVAGLISMFLMPPERFDAIAAEKFDEHKETFIKAYHEELERDKVAATVTQPEGNA